MINKYAPSTPGSYYVTVSVFKCVNAEMSHVMIGTDTLLFTTREALVDWLDNSGVEPV
jgi:hypothetical protein